MKKALLNISFILVCTAAIVFLLLPFLETTPPVTSSLNTAQPQVVSSNPLSAIAKRLASLFGRKERTALTGRSTSPASQDALAARYAFAPAPNGKTTQSNGTTAAPAAAQEVPLPSTTEPFDYADASFQTDNGEWVLIRQTAPQNSAPGMHEVNVHENPYNRFVRQERARRFGPQHTAQEIPDSKWARLMRPFKSFLGMSSATPAAPAKPHVFRENDKLASLSSAQDKLASSNGAKNSSFSTTRLPLPDISPTEWLQLPPAERERRSVAQFAELLSGNRVAEDAAEIAAMAKYPNPQNEQEKQEREAYKQRMTEINKQRIKAGVMATIQVNTADKEPVDELGYMTGCKNASLPSASDSCSLMDAQPAPPTPQGMIAQEQTQNALSFYNATQYVMPKNLPITPILGPTDPENLEHMAANPMTQPTGEIYITMDQQQQCASQKCYWVANSNQLDPQLTDAIKMANGTLKADPLNTYPTYRDAFVQEKLRQLGPNATPEQIKQAQQQALKQFKENAPAFVPYTEDQIKQMHQNTLAAANPNNPDTNLDNLTVPFITDPAIAPEFSQLVDSPVFAYNQTSLVNTPTPQEASEQMTHSMAQNVNDAKDVMNQVSRDAISEGTRSSVNQTITQFNNSGANWQNLFDTLKSKYGSAGKK